MAPGGTPLRDLHFGQGVEFLCDGRGWCPMGDDPSALAASGIVLLTLGGWNPSLTVETNAFRMSAYVINKWKGVTFRPSA